MSYRPDTSIIPIGAVIPWFGSITGCPSLPTGWQLCNGNQITDARSPMNGQNTPNLNGGSNRMVRGNTTSGGTGGADTHTLTTNEIPAHTHSVADTGHGHGNRTWVYTNPGGTPTVRQGSGTTVWEDDVIPNGNANISETSVGGGASHNNIPGYTDAIFIIRIF